MSVEQASAPPYVHALQVGQVVPDFHLETYNAGTGSFDELSLSEIRKRKKWTILFFYPADFTFV